MDSKKLWESKTFWLNIVAILAMVLNATLVTAEGVPIVDLSPELQGSILALINLVLRVITKSEITW